MCTPQRTKMANLSQDANTFRVALILGAVDVNTVIAWADSQIEASTIPENALIDISLGRSLPLQALIARLAALTENRKDSHSIKKAFGMIANQIRDETVNVESAIMKCFLFLQSENMLYHDDFRIFIKLEDDLSLIRDGIVGPDRLPQLKNDLLETLESWALLDK